jgi:hypothetical protein
MYLNKLSFNLKSNLYSLCTRDYFSNENGIVKIVPTLGIAQFGISSNKYSGTSISRSSICHKKNSTYRDFELSNKHQKFVEINCFINKITWLIIFAGNSL